jgi:hypothetical protein
VDLRIESGIGYFLVESEHGPSLGFEDRVGLEGRFQVLKQTKHGIDSGFGVFYYPKDFRGDGNVAVGLMLSRRFGRLGVFGSALVSSDTEGDDQDLDASLCALSPGRSHRPAAFELAI